MEGGDRYTICLGYNCPILYDNQSDTFAPFEYVETALAWALVLPQGEDKLVWLEMTELSFYND